MRSHLAAAAVLLSATVQQPAPPQTQTFRTGVEIVHVDVSVLDANRRPVRGLTAADFTLLEDGKPRPIVAFTPVDIPPPSEPASGTASWTREVAPDVVSNSLARDGRLVVIVLDQSLRNVEYPAAQRIARAAIDALGPEDLAAIVHTGTGSLQNFTRNRALLLSALESPFVGVADGAEWRTATPADRWLPPVSANESVAAGHCPTGNCTMETLTTLAESLRDLPRRKSLILIASSIPVQKREAPELNAFRDRLFRALDVANLTVYPVDVRGLEPLALDTTFFGVRPNPRSYVTATAANSIRQGNFKVLAERTGGRALVNANDPGVFVPDILRESSSYYTLGFIPAVRDQRFHDITVRVDRRDVSVHSRRGHFAGSLPRPAAIDVDGAPPDLVAAISGQWPRTEVPLEVAAAAFADGRERPLAAIAVHLKTAAGRIGSLVAAFNTIGQPVASHWQILDTTGVLPTEGASGLEVLARLPLDPGRYEIRSAVRDGQGKIGSAYTYVDVPNFARAPLALSGVVLELQPARLSAPDNTFEGLLPFVPTSRRDLTRSDVMNAFVRLHQGGNDPLEAVELSATVQDTRGRAVVEKRQTLGPDRFDTRRAADYRLELASAALEPGAYLLTIEAARQKQRVRREVRFTVR